MPGPQMPLSLCHCGFWSWVCPLCCLGTAPASGPVLQHMATHTINAPAGREGCFSRRSSLRLTDLFFIESI